jgi:hypothetical protein
LTDTDIYIETCLAKDHPDQPEGNGNVQPSGKGWHAQFAAAIKIRKFDELVKLKWGFDFSALLNEVLGRQRLFIESQHFPGEPRVQPPENRTLSLRFIHDAIGKRIRPYLLTKVQADDKISAIDLAIETWQEMTSIFPYDYILEPVQDRQSFLKATGWDWINQSNDPTSFIEIDRYEGIISTGQDVLFLLGSWQESMIGNEQVWRTLAGANQLIMINILLRPVVLLDYEVAILKNIVDFAERIDKNSVHPSFLPYIESAICNYKEMAVNLRHPYLIRIHLVSSESIPDYIPRTIGHAMTHSDKPGVDTPDYQVVQPCTCGELEQWKQLLCWLEPEAFSPAGYDARFSRLRNLVDAQEAVSLFRLPFPPQDGIPGVTFI